LIYLDNQRPVSVLARSRALMTIADIRRISLLNRHTGTTTGTKKLRPSRGAADVSKGDSSNHRQKLPRRQDARAKVSF
jgi:hypothetical protein